MSTPYNLLNGPLISGDWPLPGVSMPAQIHPSAIVALNHAVAVALSEGLEAGLELIDGLGSPDELHSYPLYHAARADILRRLRRYPEAIEAYHRALDLTANVVERRYLRRRLTECKTPG